MVETMVGAGILAAVIAAATSFFSQTLESQQQLEARSFTETLRTHVRGFLSCPDTFTPKPAGCSTNSYIDVKKADGSLLAAADGSTTIGDFALRARCDDRELNFEYRYRKQVAWNSLFNDIPVYCRGTGVPTAVIAPTVVMWADEGTRISFSLDTGYWDDIDPFNIDYDGNACQDMVGFVARPTNPLKIQLDNGNVIDFPMENWFRMNPRCSTYARGKVWENYGVLPNARQMPGEWGPNVFLKSARVTLQNSDDGNFVRVAQVGRKVVFTGYHSTVFTLSMTLETR